MQWACKKIISNRGGPTQNTRINWNCVYFWTEWIQSQSDKNEQQVLSCNFFEKFPQFDNNEFWVKLLNASRIYYFWVFRLNNICAIFLSDNMVWLVRSIAYNEIYCLKYQEWRRRNNFCKTNRETTKSSATWTIEMLYIYYTNCSKYNSTMMNKGIFFSSLVFPWR